MSVDLTTTYLGLRLKNPLVPSASPFSRALESMKRLEDSGASVVVMYSLFEEQVEHEEAELHHYTTYGSESHAEALSYFPEAQEYNLAPDQYVEPIRKAVEHLDIPVIGSLNGISTGGWIDYAKMIEEAGADAIELNAYYIPTDAALAGEDVEIRYVNVLRAVKESVKIPVDRVLLNSLLSSRMEELQSRSFSNLTNGSEAITVAGESYTINWTVTPVDLDGDTITENGVVQVTVSVAGSSDLSLTSIIANTSGQIGKI